MVNVNDYEQQPDALDKLGEIFKRQEDLMGQYHQIEYNNGYYVPTVIPVNLHDAQDQYKLKDFAWRILEEVGEALEAERKGQKEHTNEELADGLHFLVEWSIMIGYKPSISLDNMWVLWEPEGTAFRVRKHSCLAYRAGVLTEKLGVACNCLKNKPWKQTQMQTDVDYFLHCVCNVWEAYIQLCMTADLNAYDIYDLYFRKSEVNKFRQRSMY